MEINNFNLTPATAKANGSDAISASAVIMDNNNYASDVPVIFKITTGNAIFSNGQSSFTVASDTLGNVSAQFTDITAETVIIEVSLTDTPTAHQSQAAEFTTPSDELIIDRVYNANKDFLSTDQPSIAWIGADFYISASGGSGNYSWASHDGELLIEKYDSHTARVTFSKVLNTPNPLITLTDVGAGHSLIHELKLTGFMMLFEINTMYDSNGHYPYKKDFLTLIEEWGDMSVYAPWLPDGKTEYYWTRDDVGPGNALVISLKDGSTETWSKYDRALACGMKFS